MKEKGASRILGRNIESGELNVRQRGARRAKGANAFLANLQKTAMEAGHHLIKNSWFAFNLRLAPNFR
jgi:hypothetical protein